jgi:hypothetical protein
MSRSSDGSAFVVGQELFGGVDEVGFEVGERLTVHAVEAGEDVVLVVGQQSELAQHVEGCRVHESLRSGTRSMTGPCSGDSLRAEGGWPWSVPVLAPSPVATGRDRRHLQLLTTTVPLGCLPRSPGPTARICIWAYRYRTFMRSPEE